MTLRRFNSETSSGVADTESVLPDFQSSRMRVSRDNGSEISTSDSVSATPSERESFADGIKTATGWSPVRKNSPSGARINLVQNRDVPLLPMHIDAHEKMLALPRFNCIRCHHEPPCEVFLVPDGKVYTHKLRLNLILT